ncbi:protein kinase domain-containing protein [Nocardioides dongkuii]|uniref:protein kinase domain-containing protein n=1 Tax=Nocardioides dongkuii TaxID=2760089 RepID=UPI0015FE2B61|nr:protein kinase [Nocardioides dongkuii]
MSPPRVLGRRYEVGEVIGRGGMADVHLGHDLRSGGRVAIKVLRTDLVEDPLFLARFRREAQLVAGLRHPAIVTLLDSGCDEVDGGSADDTVRVPFIVMEYVPGWSVRDLLKRGEVTVERSIRYQLGVLSALEFSHRAGVVHRDIKPANVMITPDGAVKVVDFGIARDSSDPAATITHLQAFMGTPGYLSPEQVRGEVADARSDLYSAGCLLYELLTGRPPFVGDDPVSVAYQHVHEPPARASSHHLDLPPALDAVLATALAKSREDRFQDARAFSQALRSAAKSLIHREDGARADRVPLPC